MDINNDLQQINTFVKGMNTDVSDALMDSSQYRYAENVRLTTNKDQNTGELRLIEGTQLYQDIQQHGTIKAMTSIRNLLIIITTKVDPTTHQQEDYILVHDTSSPSALDVVYKSKDGDVFGDNLSLVTRWESDDNVKLYIADGIHQLMYINVRDKDDSGQIITTEGIQQLSGTTETFLNQPSASISNAKGTIGAVKVQYAYRLYKLGGSSTKISPLSKLIVLYKTENQGYETSTDGIIRTQNAIDVTIPAVPQEASECTNLQIFRISYLSTNSVPSVDIIYDDTYTSSYLDAGYNVSSIDYSEFLSYLGFNTIPAVIESKQDYLFSANIKDVQTNTDESFDSITTRAISSGDKNGVNVLPYNIQFSDPSTYNAEYWLNDQGIGGGDGVISWIYTDDTVYIDKTNRKYKYVNSVLTLITDQVRSLRPGEVYRYGAVLYNSKGNHSSAKWIADIMIPQDDYGVSTQQIGGTTYYAFKQIGIRFTINWSDILASCPDCVAVEIVRCPRTASDRLTITQGIAGYPLSLYDKSADDQPLEETLTLCSPGLMSTNRFAVTGWMGGAYIEDDEVDDAISVVSGNIIVHGNYVHADVFPKWENYASLQMAASNNKFLMLSSPEYTYQKDDIQNIIKSAYGIYIRHEYEASTQTASGDYEEITGYGNNIKRIKTESNTYDHGVPYAVYKMPDKIEQLWTILYLCSHGEDNGGPTFGYIPQEIQDTYTYIHTPHLQASVSNQAKKSSYLYYPGQINARTKGDPKVYISETDYNVTPKNEKTRCDVTKYGFSHVPRYNSLFDEFNFTGKDAQLVGNRYSYLDWIVPIAFFVDGNIKDIFMSNKDDWDGLIDTEKYSISGNDWYSYLELMGGRFSYPMGSTGECIILEQENATPFNNSNTTIAADIVSIRQYTQPYGGSASINTSTYYSFGDLSLVNEPPIDVYDGDCFPGAFVYNASHAWFEGGFGNGIAQANVQIVPLYSDVDLSGTFGDLFPNMQTSNKYWFQDISENITNVGYAQGNDAYMYNTAYSINGTGIPYETIKYSKIDTSMFDTRVFHSNLKTNNEHIDSWLIFGSSNYIDVDSRFGQITNMRLFKDKLLFWQEHATGILSVNERTVLNDLENNDIVVGTGGTLQRYDYISTVYGMKPDQYEAEVQSNTTQYWWDGYNKEILAYSGGMELLPLTKTKGLTNYINEREESEHPMLAYDIKYDEILSQVVKKDNTGETLVYNEQIQNFSSVYKYMPLYRANIGNVLYLSNEDSIYIQNQQDDEDYSTLFDTPIFPKVRIVVNKNNIYTKTFDNLTFGGRMYKGSFIPRFQNWPMERVEGYYIKDKDHINSPMHHLKFTFETPLKQQSSVRGDNAVSVDEYDYRLAIPRNNQNATIQAIDNGVITNIESDVQYGNRMRGKTMQCEIASDYNSTDFSLQYITTKFRMSWS